MRNFLKNENQRGLQAIVHLTFRFLFWRGDLFWHLTVCQSEKERLIESVQCFYFKDVYVSMGYLLNEWIDL